MNAEQVSAAESCLRAAYSGTMSFPEIARELIGCGFEGYFVDYRRHTTTYYLIQGGNVELNHPQSEEAVAAAFDGPGIADQVRSAQANGPDYSYATFCRNLRAFGCAGYLVSFSGRRVLYFGRTAETHVEHFPQ